MAKLPSLSCFDAVGAGAQREDAVAERDFELAANFGMQLVDLRPSVDLELLEPARDTLEARPPERARVGEVLQGRESLLADPDQLRHGVVRQIVGEFLGEGADCLVDHSAAVASAKRRVDRIERAQTEHVPRVDRIGIA